LRIVLFANENAGWVEPAMTSRGAVYTLRKLAIDGASLTKPVSQRRIDIGVWTGRSTGRGDLDFDNVNDSFWDL